MEPPVGPVGSLQRVGSQVDAAERVVAEPFSLAGLRRRPQQNRSVGGARRGHCEAGVAECGLKDDKSIDLAARPRRGCGRDIRSLDHWFAVTEYFQTDVSQPVPGGCGQIRAPTQIEGGPPDGEEFRNLGRKAEALVRSNYGRRVDNFRSSFIRNNFNFNPE